MVMFSSDCRRALLLSQQEEEAGVMQADRRVGAEEAEGEGATEMVLLQVRCALRVVFMNSVHAKDAGQQRLINVFDCSRFDPCVVNGDVLLPIPGGDSRLPPALAAILLAAGRSVESFPADFASALLSGKV